MTGEDRTGDGPDLNDNAWVDDILARALERARSTETPAAPASAPTPVPATAIKPPASSVVPAPAEPVVTAAPTPITEPLTPAAVREPALPASKPAPVEIVPAEASKQPLFPRDLAAAPSPRPTPPPAVAATVPAADTSVFAAAEPARGAVAVEEPISDDNDIPELDEYISEPVANRRMRSAIEWTAVIIGALVVAVLIKSFMFQAFYIPSPSMVPTLEVGDRILVNKLSYNLHDLNRGDLIVFHKPDNASGDVEDLVKRVIALPGENIEMREGNIYIDGKLLSEPYLKEPQSSVMTAFAPGCVEPSSASSCTVPEGMAFVMGDNRTNSTDSRIFGPIDQDLIVGRAFLRVYPFTNIGRL